MNNKTSGSAYFEPTTLDYWKKSLMTSALSVVIIEALLGNLVVVFVFCTHKPLKKFTNSFIVSLAVSDILVSFVNMPAWITNVIWNYAYTEALRNLWICMDIAAGLASILNLSAVSVCRFIEITKPYSYAEIVTKCRVFCSVIAVWVFAGIMAVLKRMVPKNSEIWYYQPGYQLLLFILFFVLPLCCISYCYFHIFKEVARQQSHLPKRMSQYQKDNFAMQIKAIKTIAIVIVMFVICWCPFFVVVVVNGFCKCVSNEHLIMFVKIMHYINSSLNPIIYVWSNRQYREAFITALTRSARKHGINFMVTFFKNEPDEDKCYDQETKQSGSALISLSKKSMNSNVIH